MLQVEQKNLGEKLLLLRGLIGPEFMQLSP